MTQKTSIAWAVLLGLAATACASANLVTNPGFETATFAGWTLIGSPAFTAVTSGPCNGGPYTSCIPHSGTYAGYLVNGPMGITQSIATTPGTTYTFDFWVQIGVPELPNNTSTPPTEFKVSWDTTVLTDILNGPVAPYQHLSFDVTATAATSVLKFEVYDWINWIGLDDVNVSVATTSSVPEPVPAALIGVSLIAFAILGARSRRRQLS